MRGFSPDLAKRTQASLSAAAAGGLHDFLAESGSSRFLAVLRDSTADPGSWVGDLGNLPDAEEEGDPGASATMEAVRLAPVSDFCPPNNINSSFTC